MKRILLPIDFSENAFNAIRYAMHLFRNNSCTFYLLNIYKPPVYENELLGYGPTPTDLMNTYRTNSLSNFKKLQERIKIPCNLNHNFVTLSISNTLIGQILKTAENQYIDLIIMGTKGATGIKEILFGTNTVHVIKKAKCPVIAVPASFNYETPKKILFPTDFQINYQKEQLKQLLATIDYHKAKVSILYVHNSNGLTEKQLENKTKLKRIMGSAANFHEVARIELIKAINDFLSTKGIHLLVMMRKEHTFFSRILREPVIEKIGFHVRIPFMVIPHLEKT